MGHFFTKEETSMIATDLGLYQGQDQDEGVGEQTGYLQELLTYPDVSAGKQVSYCIDWIQLVPEMENAIIQLDERAGQKQISIQLHVPPDDPETAADRTFFRQIFFRLFEAMIDCTNEKTIISVYLRRTETGCVIEAINHGKKITEPEPSAYFKKHRISNAFQNPANEKPDLYRIYQYILEDMGAELLYNFNSEEANYFRIKFAAGRG